MDREDYKEGLHHIADGHNSLEALKKLGKEQLNIIVNNIVNSDVSTDDKQRKHIFEKFRYEGMKQMLEYLLKEIDKESKRRK